MDDRRRDRRAGRAGVRDRERPAGDVVRAEALRPGTLGEVGDLRGQRDQALVLRGAHDGHDQTLVIEVDGDAEVHVGVHQELAVTDRRVHVRVRGDGVDDRAGHEREVAELLGPPGAVHQLEVDLRGDERVGRDLQRAQQVGACLQLDPVEGQDLVVPVGPWAAGAREYVAAGDAAVLARSSDRGRVERRFGGQVAHSGGEEAGPDAPRSAKPPIAVLTVLW